MCAVRVLSACDLLEGRNHTVERKSVGSELGALSSSPALLLALFLAEVR